MPTSYRLSIGVGDVEQSQLRPGVVDGADQILFFDIHVVGIQQNAYARRSDLFHEAYRLAGGQQKVRFVTVQHFHRNVDLQLCCPLCDLAQRVDVEVPLLRIAGDRPNPANSTVAADDRRIDRFAEFQQTQVIVDACFLMTGSGWRMSSFSGVIERTRRP